MFFCFFLTCFWKVVKILKHLIYRRNGELSRLNSFLFRISLEKKEEEEERKRRFIQIRCET